MATTAEIYAQAKRDEAAKQLQNLYDANEESYKQQTAAANASTQNILNQLTQQGTDYKAQMERDARSAYINKILGTQTVTNQLNRLGLYNTGYGVSTLGAQENTFNKNVSDLQTALAKNLATLDTQKANAQTELQGVLANLASNYANQKNSITEYINNQLTNVYNNAYNQKYKEEQDALERQRQAELFEYQKQQDKIANSQRWTQLSNNSYTYDDLGTDYDVKPNPYTNEINKDAYNGTFSNKYQPNNINGNKLKSSGKTVGQLFKKQKGSTGIDMTGQKIWTTSGRYYMWDGSINDYIDITAQYKKKFKK